MSYQLMAAESVCAGHPDKICDQVSDAIVDAVLAQDPNGRVALETAVSGNRIILMGEVGTNAHIEYEQIARSVIERLGYTEPAWGFSHTSPVDVLVGQQSPHIAQGVDEDGAGDQGLMYGFACRETPELMPLPIMIAHALTRRIDQARENGELAFLRPDGKSQVVVRYENDQPIAVEHVTLAVAHNEETKPTTVRAQLYQAVVKPVLAGFGYEIKPEQLIVNGTGIWHIPGPASDAGLTGRKIVVDTYGGYARVGGGAFSGKDPTKVDRSGAYAARYLAKNLVAAGLADRAEVALAYVIGQPRPVLQQMETFGTATVSPAKLDAAMVKLLDTSVAGILKALDLRRPIYQETAAYGHFGTDSRPWEQLSSILAK
jgi:S-adenosylmethionine synthetase